jgi:hypothetical protein
MKKEVDGGIRCKEEILWFGTWDYNLKHQHLHKTQSHVPWELGNKDFSSKKTVLHTIFYFCSTSFP